jgi:hypothetical protein
MWRLRRTGRKAPGDSWISSSRVRGPSGSTGSKKLLTLELSAWKRPEQRPSAHITSGLPVIRSQTATNSKEAFAFLQREFRHAGRGPETLDRFEAGSVGDPPRSMGFKWIVEGRLAA